MSYSLRLEVYVIIFDNTWYSMTSIVYLKYHLLGWDKEPWRQKSIWAEETGKEVSVHLPLSGKRYGHACIKWNVSKYVYKLRELNGCDLFFIDCISLL